MQTDTIHEPPCNADPSKLFCFYRYLEGRSLTRSTGYRYRQQGLIKTVNIFGRLYVTRQEIEKFERRALNGDFHKPKTPDRNCVATRRGMSSTRSRANGSVEEYTAAVKPHQEVEQGDFSDATTETERGVVK